MKPDIDYTLYLCTDRNIMTTETIEESVELAIKGGVSVVQLREKECSSREFYEMAKAVKTITDAFHLIVVHIQDLCLLFPKNHHLHISFVPLAFRLIIHFYSSRI